MEDPSMTEQPILWREATKLVSTIIEKKQYYNVNKLWSLWSSPVRPNEKKFEVAGVEPGTCNSANFANRGALYRSSNFNFKECYGDQCYAGVVCDRVLYNKASDLFKHE